MAGMNLPKFLGEKKEESASAQPTLEASPEQKAEQK